MGNLAWLSWDLCYVQVSQTGVSLVVLQEFAKLFQTSDQEFRGELSW